MLFEYNPSATVAGHERLTERAQALRQTLLPLRAYVQHRTATLDPTSPYAAKTFEHLRHLEAAFRAVAEYHQVVEELMRVHLPREQQAQLRTLRAEREADPLYRLGYVRGYQRGLVVGQQANKQVLGLYARYFLPPFTAPPVSPLVARVQHFLDTLTARAQSESSTASQRAA